MRSFICCIMAAACVSAFAAGFDTQKRIPDSCTAVITVSNIQSDPGISWMINAWLASARKSPLKDVFKAAAPQEMSVAFLPETKERPMNVLVVVAFAKGVSPDKAKMDKTVMADDGDKLSLADYKGTAIVSGSAPAGAGDFGAYAVIQNTVILASDAETVRRAIDGPSVAAAANYQKISAQSAKGTDALLFADNAEAKFAKFLTPREKKWKLTLLLSAPSLQYMGSSFDIVDSSKVTGTILFQGADKAKLAEIKEDAEFIGEAFKRKFMAEKIQYTGKVEVTDLTVKLAFQVEGLEPLWKKLFDGGVFALFAPEN